MARRIPVILLLLAILGYTGWTLLQWNGPIARSADPWRALPAQTAVVVEVPAPIASWDRWTHTAQLWDAIGLAENARALDAFMERIAALAEEQPELAQRLDRQRVLFAVEGNSERTAWVAIVPLPRALPGVEQLGKAIGVDLGERSPAWSGTAVPLSTDAPWAGLRFAWHDGLALVGPDAALIDEALLSMANKAPITDSTFLRARSTLGAGTDGHVLVHLDRARRLLGRWLTNATVDHLRWPQGWAALDLRVRPEAVLLGGLLFTHGPDTLLDAITAQGNGRTGVMRVLPTTVTTCRTQQVSDAQAYLAARGPVNDSLAAATFLWCQGVFALATAPDTAAEGQRTWGVFQTVDPEAPYEAIGRLCPTGGCDTTAHRGVRMVRFPVAGALGTVLGDGFDALEQPWYAVLGDKAVCSDRLDAVKEAIDASLDGRTLATDARNADFLQQFATEAACTFWADAGQARSTLRTRLRTEAGGQLNDAVLAGLGRCLLQVGAPVNGTYPLALCLQHGSAVPQAVGTLWTTNVGRPIKQGPFVVRNHVNNTREVVVQDDEHTLYLLGSTGSVLWKHALDGPILGEVRQVDKFKNGKLQLLFNTAQRIHLIDRNGKDLAGFPVKLPEEASAPLNAFDYEGNKEYRVLLPTVNAKLLNYDLNGRAVQGWTPPATPAPCEVAVQHLRIRAKDHLVLVDRNGGITVLDRKGAPRYAAKGQVPSGGAPVGLRAALDIGACSVLWSDNAGQVFGSTFDGKRTDPLTSALAEGSKGLYLYNGRKGPATADLNLDGAPETITANGDGRVVVQRAQP
ncbi:MAG: hypothetical protein JNL05_03670 [Flavobacteriales bacterium]|nr:hypothetical protein [Flavobacteriales bacterium]